MIDRRSSAYYTSLYNEKYYGGISNQNNYSSQHRSYKQKQSQPHARTSYTNNTTTNRYNDSTTSGGGRRSTIKRRHSSPYPLVNVLSIKTVASSDDNLQHKRHRAIVQSRYSSRYDANRQSNSFEPLSVSDRYILRDASPLPTIPILYRNSDYRIDSNSHYETQKQQQKIKKERHNNERNNRNSIKVAATYEERGRTSRTASFGSFGESLYYRPSVTRSANNNNNYISTRNSIRLNSRREREESVFSGYNDDFPPPWISTTSRGCQGIYRNDAEDRQLYDDGELDLNINIQPLCTLRTNSPRILTVRTNSPEPRRPYQIQPMAPPVTIEESKLPPVKTIFVPPFAAWPANLSVATGEHQVNVLEM